MSSKIVVVSTYNKTYEDIFKLIYPHNKKYFDKYNIEYNPILIDCEDGPVKNSYMKFEIINNLIKNRDDIDYVWSLDIDVVICNFDIDLRIITSMSQKDLLFCSVLECSPDMYWNINSGSILIKNSTNGKMLINLYMSTAQQDNFQINDQVLWQKLLLQNNMIRSYVSIFPANSFNAGGKDFFLHHELSASSTLLPAQEACKKKLSILENTIRSISCQTNKCI